MRLAESVSSVSPDCFDEFLPTRVAWTEIVTRINRDIPCYEDECPEADDYEAEVDHPHDSFVGGLDQC